MKHSYDDLQIPEDFDMTESFTEDPLTPLPEGVENPFFVSKTGLWLSRGPGSKWDGCAPNQLVRGGFNSNHKCSPAFFHPAFMTKLNRIFFSCIRSSSQSAGYPEPHQVFVKHVGVYNDRLARNSSRLSMHAYARAWDIVNFNMYDAQGQLHRVSTYRRHYSGKQALFYDHFRECWKNSLPDSCSSGRESKGSIGHQASKFGGNSLHNDHLHLSYPFCAGSS